MAAHQALEDTVNTKLQNQFRHQVAQRWAELVYVGFFYEPHKADLEAYLRSSQVAVDGEVTLETQGGSLLAVAVESPNILQDKAPFTHKAATGRRKRPRALSSCWVKSSTMAARMRKPVTSEQRG